MFEEISLADVKKTIKIWKNMFPRVFDDLQYIDKLEFKEDLLELKQDLKLNNDVMKELIEEGGQQGEELTHWILPDDIFMTYVLEYRDRSIKWLRIRAG